MIALEATVGTFSVVHSRVTLECAVVLPCVVGAYGSVGAVDALGNPIVSAR